MTDPAIEASQRAWAAIAHDNMMIPTEVTIAAAREALKPVREWYENHGEVASAGPRWAALKKLIYTTEELNRDR